MCLALQEACVPEAVPESGQGPHPLQAVSSAGCAACCPWVRRCRRPLGSVWCCPGTSAEPPQPVCVETRGCLQLIAAASMGALLMSFWFPMYAPPCSLVLSSFHSSNVLWKPCETQISFYNISMTADVHGTFFSLQQYPLWNGISRCQHNSKGNVFLVI